MYILRLALCLLLPAAVVADEGMWPYNRLPLGQLKATHSYHPDEALLQRLQQASVRLNNGGSGSFVSPQGLLMTNHHVAADCIRKLSSEGHDYIANGFYATTRARELKCPDLEINVLMGVEDITERVNADVTAEMSDAERQDVQKAAQARIAKDCQDSTLLRCDIVNLYQGGIFDLYKYKRYSDVRLVFAPEMSVAFFGGDTDNFNYPRYCLDVAFLRAYDKDAPATPPAWLAFEPKGTEEGDLTIVSGHPGSTRRLLTADQLAFERDVRLPFTLDWLQALAGDVAAYGRGGGEAARLARDELFRFNNSLKAMTGQLAGLRDRELFSAKEAKEAELRKLIAAQPELQRQFGDAWEKIAESQKAKRRIYEEYRLLDGYGFWTKYFTIAKTLYRLAEELPKPNEERLEEYRDTALESLYQQLYSPAPIYPEIETVKLAASLKFLRDRLGVNHPVVKRLLEGRTPEIVANELVSGTQLSSVELRKSLASDNAAKAKTSEDKMLVLARAVDAESRRLRKQFEDEVEAVESAHGARIARARFAAVGDSAYPDATFTLRLAFGRVLAYLENRRRVDAYTVIDGLFARATDEEPYALPAKIKQAKSRLNGKTPYNLVTTNDITGGNSGSPLINREGKIVGLIFDGNIQSLSNDFLYSERQARAVSVDVRGILEMLRNAYRARRLTAELTAN